MRPAFTLIELLVVIVILSILAILLLGAFGAVFATPHTFDAKVIDKWTDFDGDGTTIYRIRTQAADGEVNTWNSWWVHNQIQNGVYYRFTSKMQSISKIENIPQPVAAE